MCPKGLLRGIGSGHAGQRRHPHDVGAELAAHATDDALTPRELQVLEHVAAGKSNRVVAADLDVSEDTIKAHMKNIMSKLGANDRTHAVMIALKRGIIAV